MGFHPLQGGPKYGGMERCARLGMLAPPDESAFEFASDKRKRQWRRRRKPYELEGPMGVAVLDSASFSSQQRLYFLPLPHGHGPLRAVPSGGACLLPGAT